jgi:hypothetical protein
MEHLASLIESGNHAEVYEAACFLLNQAKNNTLPDQIDQDKIAKILIVAGVHSERFVKVLKFIVNTFGQFSIKINLAKTFQGSCLHRQF